MSFFALGMKDLAAPLIGGALGGLFGKPSMPDDMRRLLRMQVKIARQLRDRGNSIPLSQPQEQAALAQERALLGEQQRLGADQLYSQMRPGSAQGLSNTSAQDFSRNLMLEQQGQQSALTSRHLLSALETRRQSLIDAANVARGGVAGFPQINQGGAGLGDVLANFARMGAALDASKRPRTAPVGTDRQVPVNTGVVHGPAMPQPYAGPFHGSQGGGDYASLLRTR